MFMRVNSKCAHHLHPPVARMERYSAGRDGRPTAGSVRTASGACAGSAWTGAIYWRWRIGASSMSAERTASTPTSVLSSSG
jgi:hypothetical protein